MTRMPLISLMDRSSGMHAGVCSHDVSAVVNVHRHHTGPLSECRREYQAQRSRERAARDEETEEYCPRHCWICCNRCGLQCPCSPPGCLRNDHLMIVFLGRRRARAKARHSNQGVPPPPSWWGLGRARPVISGQPALVQIPLLLLSAGRRANNENSSCRSDFLAIGDALCHSWWRA
ncbi:hypothetical protein MRX96_002499 [Rhipicephalus microplus]